MTETPGNDTPLKKTHPIGAAVGGLTVLVTMVYGLREMRKAEKAEESEDAE